MKSVETTLSIGRGYKKVDPNCDARSVLTISYELS